MGVEKLARRALTLLGVLAIVGVAGLSLLIPNAVNADEHSATRSFISSSVAAGAEIEIQITVDNLGSFGQVEETLPEGFIFLRSDDLDATSIEASGRSVKFTLFGEETFHYTVSAPQIAGTYEFSGTVSDDDRDERDVGGSTSVEVSAPLVAVATRTLSSDNIVPGRQLVVSVAVSEYGIAGSLTETIPAGFRYVPGVDQTGISVGDGSITFTLLGEENITYTLTAPDDPGVHNFVGTITNFDKASQAVGGTARVTVDPRPAATAARSFEAARVEVGAEVSVTIALEDYGVGAKLVESLPEGFSFISSDLGVGATSVAGQNVTFYLLGEDSVSYRAVSPADEGSDGVYTFSGVLSDIDKNEVDVSGDTHLLVGTVLPTFSDEESGVRQINENTPADVRIGEPIMASAAVGGLTFEITSAAADTFNIESDTGQLRTKGDLDYETRASYSLKVTATDEFGGSASIVVTIQVLDRDEYVPPTATPEPTATPRPEPTNTPVPQPTATAAPAPTATSVPVEPTATPVVEEPEDEGGFPAWAIVIIVIAAVVVVGGGGFVLYRRQQG